MKKAALFLTLLSGGTLTAMLPRIIPGDLIATAHGEATTPLKRLRWALLCNNGRVVDELLPTITVHNWEDSHDYKEFFCSILTAVDDTWLRKYFDHTVKILQTPESKPYMRWMENTFDLIQIAAVRSRSTLGLTRLFEYIEEGKFPTNPFMHNEHTNNLKGLLIEQLLDYGNSAQLVLLCNRGILTRAHCTTPLAKEALANLDRLEADFEFTDEERTRGEKTLVYCSELHNRQGRLRGKYLDLMTSIPEHNVAAVKEQLNDPTCPVNARFESWQEMTPLMYALYVYTGTEAGHKEPEAQAAAEEILKLLLDHKDVDVNLMDGRNRSALAHAAAFNEVSASKALEILLQYHDEKKKLLTVLSKPNLAHKVLVCAIKEGYLAGAYALAQRKEIDTNLLGAQGEHALHVLAAQNKACAANPAACQQLVLTLAERGARFNLVRRNPQAQEELFGGEVATDLTPFDEARENIPPCVLFRACGGRALSKGFGHQLVRLQRLKDHELQDTRYLWFREFWNTTQLKSLNEENQQIVVAAGYGTNLQLAPARVTELCPFSLLNTRYDSRSSGAHPTTQRNARL